MPMLAHDVFVSYCLYGGHEGHLSVLLVRVSACLDDVACAKMSINRDFYERGIHLEIADMN